VKGTGGKAHETSDRCGTGKQQLTFYYFGGREREEGLIKRGVEIEENRIVFTPAQKPLGRQGGIIKFAKRGIR